MVVLTIENISAVKKKVHQFIHRYGLQFTHLHTVILAALRRPGLHQMHFGEVSHYYLISINNNSMKTVTEEFPHTNSRTTKCNHKLSASNDCIGHSGCCCIAFNHLPSPACCRIQTHRKLSLKNSYPIFALPTFVNTTIILPRTGPRVAAIAVHIASRRGDRGNNRVSSRMG